MQTDIVWGLFDDMGTNIELYTYGHDSIFVIWRVCSMHVDTLKPYKFVCKTFKLCMTI